MNSDLDIAFENAFEKISKLKGKVAPDVMLKLYAYYKQATSGNHFFFNNKESDVITAFKFNAWTQLNGMPEDDAKKEYIALVNTII